MNTSYLKTFIEVINMRNISKTAEKLFITQPAVSKQLQLLEKDFETTLIKKNGREIMPTEEGLILYKYAKSILNEEDEIYSLLKNENKVSGKLTIYSSSLPADYYIHDLVSEFSIIYPEVTFCIKKVDSKKVYSTIENGLTSFGFTGNKYKNNKIQTICIATDEVVIVTSKKREKEFKDKSIDIKMLMSQDFIIREKGSATLQIFEEYLKENQLKLEDLNIKIQAEDNELIKKFVKCNMGLAILPKKAVEKEIQDGTLILVNVKELKLKRRLYYVFNKDRYFSKTENKFKDYIINKFSKDAE